MGGKSSKEGSYRQRSSYRSSSGSSSAWNEYPQSSYGQESQSYYASQPSYPPQQSYGSPQSYTVPPQQLYAPAAPDYGVGHATDGRRLDRRYSRIADDYNSLDEVNIKICNIPYIFPLFFLAMANRLFCVYFSRVV